MYIDNTNREFIINEVFNVIAEDGYITESGLYNLFDYIAYNYGIMLEGVSPYAWIYAHSDLFERKITPDGISFGLSKHAVKLLEWEANVTDDDGPGPIKRAIINRIQRPSTMASLGKSMGKMVTKSWAEKQKTDRHQSELEAKKEESLRKHELKMAKVNRRRDVALAKHGITTSHPGYAEPNEHTYDDHDEN